MVEWLLGLSLLFGGYYTGSGPHPHVSFNVQANLGPIEAFHTPLTQTGDVTDLYGVGLSFRLPDAAVSPTLSIGNSWAGEWGTCDPSGYICDKEWTTDIYYSAGISFVKGLFRGDLKWTFVDPMNGLVFLMGVSI